MTWRCFLSVSNLVTVTAAEAVICCLQAQSAAAAAENSALDAGKYARTSHCIKALTAAQAAAQSFNLVCLCSCLALKLRLQDHEW